MFLVLEPKMLKPSRDGKRLTFDIWANSEVIVTKSSIKYPLRLISNSKVPDEGSRLVS